MKLRTVMVGVVSVALLAMSAWAAEKISLDGVKCVMNPKGPAKEATAVDYQGGKVFFCCGNCAKKFTADPKKHAVRANQQLAATKQAKQVKCPFSGHPCSADHTVKVGTVKVAFCCGKCQAKVADAEPAKQAELVFNSDAFAKAFKMAKAKE